jgi:hypothetical protein
MSTNTSNNLNSTINKIYEETSNLGKYQLKLGIISGVIISIIFFICGIVNIFTWDNKLIDINGTITDSNCSIPTFLKRKGQVATTYTCNINVQVTENENIIKKLLVIKSSKEYKINDTVRVTLDKRDINNIVMVLGINRMSTTWIFIIGGILLGLTYIGYIIYTSKYAKIFESGYGTLNLIKTVLN